MSRTLGLNAGSSALGGSCASMSFADLFLMSGVFNGYGPNHVPGPGYDAQGWPVYVDGSTGTTTIQLGLDAHLPAGTYTITYQGTGTARLLGGSFSFPGNPTITFDGSPVTLTLASPSAPGVLLFEINASTQGNPLRNLKFLLPGHAGRIYYQGYLDRFAGYKAIRFLDWSVINVNSIQDWSEAQRIGGTGFSFYQRGRICEEYQQALINEIKQYNGEDLDWWLQSPQFPSDNWRQGAHDLIQGGATIDGHTIAPLNAGSAVRYEHSNECWNGAFIQNGQMRARKVGADAALCATWQAAHPTISLGDIEYIAHLKAYNGRKFKDLFAGSGRVVKTTLMTMGGITDIGDAEILHFGLPNLYDGLTTPIDVFGAGFYCQPESAHFVYTDTAALAVQYQTDPVGALNTFFAGYPQCIADFAPQLVYYKGKANTIGAEFAIYEMGLSANSWTAVDSTARTREQAFLLAAFTDPRHEGVVGDMLAALPDNSGPYCWYFSEGTYGNYLWGALQYVGQPLNTAPIERALQAAMGNVTPPVRAPRRHIRGMGRLRAA